MGKNKIKDGKEGGVILSKFKPEKGLHYGSSAIRSILKYYGIEINEGLCFGLGAGIDFIYVKNLPYPIKELIYVRGENIEDNALKELEIKYEKHKEKSTQVALKKIKERIEQNKPVIVQCDLNTLRGKKFLAPYPGYKTAVVGYCDNEKKFFLYDCNLEDDYEEVSYDTLKEALEYKDNTMFGKSNVWYELNVDDTFKLTEEKLQISIYRAIKMAAHNLLNYREYKHKKVKFYHGLMATRKFLKEVVKWREKYPNWQDFFRFQYEVLETIYTGGSGLRKLWLEFIDTADDLLPGIKKVTQRYRNFLVDRWRKLALSFKKISDGNWDFLPKLQKIMQDIADKEENYMRELLMFVDASYDKLIK